MISLMAELYSAYAFRWLTQRLILLLWFIFIFRHMHGSMRHFLDAFLRRRQLPPPHSAVVTLMSMPTLSCSTAYCAWVSFDWFIDIHIDACGRLLCRWPPIICSLGIISCRPFICNRQGYGGRFALCFYALCFAFARAVRCLKGCISLWYIQVNDNFITASAWK